MAVEEGKFRLYTSIEPKLKAGDWHLIAKQILGAQTSTTLLDSSNLKIEETDVNFRVRSPRYIMPPDQVLSTYPPANSFGSYGSRLPQVVIKRRTLPWEREIKDQPKSTPWLALVLITEKEAILESGVKIADCITAGKTLSGVADVEKGNRLRIKKSMVDKVFPTQNDVELLAHAREVDINDTELMMGDDDGFLSVVISNRLPVPAKDDHGEDTPVKYTACLINLEEQFDSLLEKSPDPVLATDWVVTNPSVIADTASYDHAVMGSKSSPDNKSIAATGIDITLADNPVPLAQPLLNDGTSVHKKSGVINTRGTLPNSHMPEWSKPKPDFVTAVDVSLKISEALYTPTEFVNVPIDRELIFPVLMHWSFTTTGTTTFESLMTNLDSRLLGDVSEDSSDLSGRLPLEVVETGHVGLAHKTREGDDVRSWYRGPLVPHPTISTTTDRLPLAHSSDQLRIVIPDGREDLSLAAAFEVGRLLSLSQPAMIASLMRWRQEQYNVARTASLVEVNRTFWAGVLGNGFLLEDTHQLGALAGRFFVDAITKNPEIFLGSPRPSVSSGRPIENAGVALDTLATGLGIKKAVFKGDIGTILEKVKKIDTPAIDLILGDLGKIGIRESLETKLNSQRINLVSNSLISKFKIDPITGPAFPAIERPAGRVVPDVLDRILATTRDSDNEDE